MVNKDFAVQTIDNIMNAKVISVLTAPEVLPLKAIDMKRNVAPEVANYRETYLKRAFERLINLLEIKEIINLSIKKAKLKTLEDNKTMLREPGGQMKMEELLQIKLPLSDYEREAE